MTRPHVPRLQKSQQFSHLTPSCISQVGTEEQRDQETLRESHGNYRSSLPDCPSRWPPLSASPLLLQSSLLGCCWALLTNQGVIFDSQLPLMAATQHARSRALMRGSSFWWEGPLCLPHITGCSCGPRFPFRLGCIGARGQCHVNSAPTGGWAISGRFTSAESANSFYPHSPHSKAASLRCLQMKVMRPGAGGRTDLIPFAQFTGRLPRCVCQWKRSVHK